MSRRAVARPEAGAAEPAAPPRTFHLIDALRGLAAAAVVLFHGGFLFGVKPAEGHLAVDLFFVMSGFVVAFRYDADLARGMGVRRFLTVRLVRLYPLYLLGAAAGLIPSLLELAVGGPSAYHEGVLAAVPAALLMLPSRAVVAFTPVLYPLNLVSWSLAFELLINVVFAAGHRRCSLAVLAGAVVLGFLGLCAGAAAWGTLQVGFEWPHAVGGFARVTFGFATGVLIKRLLDRGIAMPHLPWWLVLAGTALLLSVQPFNSVVLAEAVGCLVFVPLVAAAAAVSEPPARLHRLCGAVGSLSYAVYCLQEPVIGLVLRAGTRVPILARGWVPALLFTGLLVAAACAAEAFYDRPVRRVLSRALAPSRGIDKSRRSVPAPASPGRAPDRGRRKLLRSFV